jgi:RNA polymerase nonessential primary-like sigma factor
MELLMSDIEDSNDGVENLDNTDYDISSVDCTQIYLNDIRHAKLLTAKEEIELSKLAKKGDVAAKQRMIVSNLRLVTNIAKRYYNSSLDYLDLIEEGNLGLMHAVDKFDPELGFRFSTYATRWIRQNIERAIMNHGRTVRLPVHIAQEVQNYRKQAHELAKALQHQPSIKEITKVMHKSEEEVREIVNLDGGTVSIDAQIFEDGGGKTFSDAMVDENNIDPAQKLQDENVICLIDNWLERLGDLPKEVIIRRFGLCGYDRSSLKEVSEAVNISCQKARQIQNVSLRKLRIMARACGFASFGVL